MLRDYAASSLVLIGDAAVEPLVAFLHDPDASKVEKESERVLAFASTRLTASSALKKTVLETLAKLGWEPPKGEDHRDLKAMGIYRPGQGAWTRRSFRPVGRFRPTSQTLPH